MLGMNYYNEEVPLQLDKKEMKNLLIKKDEKSIQTLIEHNLRLVLKIINTKYYSTEYNRNELISLGNLALVKAAFNFDPKRNIEFSTYASRCIINELNQYIKNLNKEPIIDSYDEPIFNEKSNEELYLKNILPTDEDIERDYLDKELIISINTALNILLDTEKEIIKMSFGFYKRKYTQMEIAKMLNITQSNVSYIIKRALAKIKKYLIENKLIDIKRLEKR